MTDRLKLSDEERADEILEGAQGAFELDMETAREWAEADRRIREEGRLTALQLGELDENEYVVAVEDGWAETAWGVYITADGDRIFGPGSGRTPGDARDRAALAAEHG